MNDSVTWAFFYDGVPKAVARLCTVILAGTLRMDLMTAVTKRK